MRSCVKPSSALVLSGIILIVSLIGTQAQISSATAAKSPCNTYGLASSYDVIVVGSGPGGSVAARRLAQNNPHLQVLQIERGIPYTSCEYCSSATHVFLNGEQPNTHNTINTAPQTHLPGSPVIGYIDASVQGGASSINGIYACRGTADYFFNTFWPSNWDWTIMKEFFRAYESYYFPTGMYGPGGFDYAANVRGTSGPVKVTEKSALDQNDFIKHFNAAAAAVLPGLPVMNNGSCNNGNHPGIGASPTETTTFQDTRSSAWSSYMEPYTGNNLKTISLTRVNKVLFSGTQVTGVEITLVNPANSSSVVSYGKTCNVNSNSVILSAGSVGTPRILMHSGIGPGKTLRSLGIPVVVDNENVGANLHDHFGLLIPTTVGPVPVSQNSGNDWAWAFWNEANDATKPITFDIQYTTSGDFVTPFGYMNPNRVFADSVGEVSITSADPDVNPYLNFNYLSTANDQQIMAYALEKALAIMNTLGLSGSNPCTAGVDCSTPNKTLNAYIAAGQTSIGYHLTGTASICSVVNPNHLNVKGTQGLYVLDGSIFPLTPSCNTQVPIYAASERGILLIQDAILNGYSECEADYASCN